MLKSCLLRIFYLAGIMLSYSLNLFSQSCANYVVTRNTGITYSSIAGSSPSFFTWRNTASNQNDDNRSFQAPIGFDFWYLGVRYTRFSGDLNGFIDFSSSTSDGNSAIMSPPYAYAGNYQNVFSTANASMLVVAAMYDDIWTAGGGATAIASSLVYKTTGVAPNRVLTVEWINFDKFTSSSGSINFQIKLYETTGVIEIIYGSILEGSTPYVYCCGINGNWTSGSPTSADLLTQQIENTAIFNNTPQNNLSATPTNNSKLTFTPPSPSAAPISLTFSSVTKTGMNLNWNNNANNEIGYVIYNSTDNVNFSFVTQTIANATSAAIIGLTAGTTYYWQVYAVTEGKLSTALTGTKATLPPGSISSSGTGSWNSTSTWNCSCVPTAGDNVTIANGHTVTLNTNGSCNNLTVGQGTSGRLTIGNNSNSRSLTISGDVTINNGATITLGNSAATHNVTVVGNITNNGTLNLAPSGTRICNVTVNKNGNQMISGSGTTTNFNLITLNMGSSNLNVLEVTTTNFSAATNFLTLTNGTFKLSSAATVTAFNSAVTIPASCGLWVNNSSAIINSANGTITLFGYVRATAGNLNIGNASDNNLTSYGGKVIIDGGNINIAGRLDKYGPTILTDFEMSSGRITVNTVGSTTGGIAPFTIDEVGSTFNLSGGTIIIERPGAGNLGYINTGGTMGTISGGTIQIGDASTPVSQTIQINSSIAIPNLVISNGVSVTTELSTNSLTVNNNVTINSGTFDANSLNINIGGNWTNNGTFNPGSGTVIFNGTTAQTLGGTNSTTSNNLIINKVTNSVTLTKSLTVNGTLSLTNGRLIIGANDLNLNGNFSGSSANCLESDGVSSRISIGGSGAIGNLFFDQTTPGTTNRIKEFSYNRNAQTITLGNALEIIDSVTPTAGTLATGGFLKLVSNSSGTARIAAGSGSYISGNVKAQRYIPAIARRYRFLSSPISNTNLEDWRDEIFVTGSGVGNTVGTLNSNGFDATQTNIHSVYWYDETLNLGSHKGWTAVTNSTPSLTNVSLITGKGYRVMIRGDRSSTHRIDGTDNTQNDVTLDLNGTVNTGNISMPVTYNSTGVPVNDGWCLLGNPYPSLYDWNSFWNYGNTGGYNGTNYTNIGPSVYIFDDGSNSYFSYNAASQAGSLTNGFIPSGAAFFIQTKAASPALTFVEQFKSFGTYHSTFKTDPSNELMITFKADSINFDKFTLRYMTGATNHYDLYDIPKMLNPTVNLWSLDSDQVKLATSIRNPVFQNDTICLGLSSTGFGAHEFIFSNYSNFATGKKILLKDSYTKSFIEVIKNPVYTFDINSDPNSYGNNRFTLLLLNDSTINAGIMQPVQTLLQSAIFVFPNPANSTLKFSNVISSILEITIFDIAGKQVLKTIENKNSDRNTIETDIQNLFPGLYFVELKTLDKQIQKLKFVKL